MVHDPSSAGGPASATPDTATNSPHPHNGDIVSASHSVTASAVTVTDVVAGIHGTPIVSDATFTVAAGTMTAVVGVNGAGKSTLLRAIAGITKPLHGSITIAADDITQLSPRERALKVAFVGQEETPPADLTVAELVALGRLPHRAFWQLGGKKEQHIVENALELVDMAALKDRPCGQLSGGQRRRALLARGFAQHTPVLLADEPTNHLDVHHQHHLLEVMRASGRTIIATIHDVDLAYSHFDQVVIINDGTTHSVGRAKDVLGTTSMRECFDVTAWPATNDQWCRPHLIVDGL